MIDRHRPDAFRRVTCPGCQGRMRLLAVVKNPAGIARYLAAAGELTDVPSRAPGRGPPYWKSQVLRRLRANTFTFSPELPSYTIVNARVGFIRDKWDAALYASNLTDARALLGLDQERGTRARVGYLTNPPRALGVAVRVKY